MESICGGVPVICWPFFAEQQTNCRYACTTWGIGMEVNHDVKRGDIEALVKEMMDGMKERNGGRRLGNGKRKLKQRLPLELRWFFTKEIGPEPKPFTSPSPQAFKL
ncbi:hypothetical protein CUMW_208330 [Citrus unshiu]|nr:hypothetical protein CUMW_208330 [Citrus unshiu]